MAGPACHFELKEGAIPAAIRGSRPVSAPLMPRLKQELDLLEKQEIIRKVTEPTAWVHPMVLATKKHQSLCGFHNLKSQHHPADIRHGHTFPSSANDSTRYEIFHNN
jgi:hypothetical protein